MTNQDHQLSKNFLQQSHGLFTEVAEQAQLFIGSYDSGVYFPKNKKRKIYVGTIRELPTWFNNERFWDIRRGM